MIKRHETLGNEKLIKLIMKLCIPTIMGLTLTAMYNIVDRIFVGHGVGSEALAGVGVVFPVMVIVLAFTLLISVGASTLVSIKLGEKKKDEVENTLGNACALAVIIGILLIAGVFIFMKQLLTVLGAAETSLFYGQRYLQIVVFSIIFQMVRMVLNEIIRSEGNAIMAFYTLIIGNILNLILNPLFIFVLKMGVRGAALATIISEFVTSVWVIIYFVNNKNSIKLRLKYLIPKFSIIKKILQIGITPFILQITFSITLIVSNITFKQYGNGEGLVVMTILGTISLFLNKILVGMQRGIQAIIGYNYGAKNYKRVKRTNELAILITTVICITCFIPIFFFSRRVLYLFTSENSSFLSTSGALALRYYFITLPLLGFITLGSGYFTAVGKFKQALLFVLLRQGGVITCLIILPRIFGYIGAVIAYPSIEFIMAIVIAIMFIVEWRRLGTEQSIQNEQNQLVEQDSIA